MKVKPNSGHTNLDVYKFVGLTFSLDVEVSVVIKCVELETGGKDKILRIKEERIR